MHVSTFECIIIGIGLLSSSLFLMASVGNHWIHDGFGNSFVLLEYHFYEEKGLLDVWIGDQFYDSSIVYFIIHFNSAAFGTSLLQKISSCQNQSLFITYRCNSHVCIMGYVYHSTEDVKRKCFTVGVMRQDGCQWLK